MLRIPLTQSRTFFTKIHRPSASRVTFLILPEVGKESNTSYNVNHNDLINRNFCDDFIDLSKLLLNNELDIGKICREPATDKGAENIDKLFDIEKLMTGLESRFSSAIYGKIIRDDEFEDDLYDILYRKIMKATTDQLYTTNTMELIERIKSSKSVNKHKRFSDYHLKQIELNCKFWGSHFNIDDKNSIYNKLEELYLSQVRFNQNIIDAEKQLKINLERSNFSDDIPESILDSFKLSQDNKYEVNLRNNKHLESVLKYIPDQKLRTHIWLESQTAINQSANKMYNQNINMYRIKTLRKEIAELHGNKSYLDFLISYNKRMPKSINDIVQVLEHYHGLYLPEFAREYSELSNYARTTMGLKDRLRERDYFYVKKCYSKDVGFDHSARDLSAVVIQDLCQPEELFHKMINALASLFDFSVKSSSEAANNMSTVPTKQYLIVNNNSSDNCHQLLYQVNVTVQPLKSSKIALFRTNLRQCEVILNSNFAGKSLTTESYFDLMKIQQVILCDIFNRHNYTVTDLFQCETMEWKFMTLYLICYLFGQSHPLLRHIFPDTQLDNLKKFSENIAEIVKGNTFNNLQAIYWSYCDLEMCYTKLNPTEVPQEIWRQLFESSGEQTWFPYESDDVKLNWRRDIFSDFIWSGATNHFKFWASYHMKPLIDELNKAGYQDCTPNTTTSNKQIQSLLRRFRTVFLDEFDLYPSNTMITRLYSKKNIFQRLK